MYVGCVLDSGEVLVLRVGRKIAGVYTLVAVLYKSNKMKLVVRLKQRVHYFTLPHKPKSKECRSYPLPCSFSGMDLLPIALYHHSHYYQHH